VYLGLFVRSAIRRSKQVRFRRERVVVEVPPEESAATARVDEDDEPEKIEVHVHVHRGDGSKKSRSKRPAPPVLTGALFDWQWYKEILSKRPQQAASGRWSRAVKCANCASHVSSTARYCPRCAAPIARRRFGALVRALLGLGTVALVFGLCAHFLGGSVPESRAPAPLGEWTTDDYVIVEVPAPTPAINSMPPPPDISGASGTSVATR
jgi:hypothetical protein